MTPQAIKTAGLAVKRGYSSLRPQHLAPLKQGIDIRFEARGRMKFCLAGSKTRSGAGWRQCLPNLPQWKQATDYPAN